MTYQPNVTICLPAYGGHVTSYTTESIFTLAQWMANVKIQSQLCWLDMNGIEDCRNTFLTIWYDHFPESTHLLFVDGDMKFSHEMVRDMLRFDKPVVGCMYSKRQRTPAAAVGSVLKDGETPADTVEGFLKVRAVGAGVLLIRRDAITTMLEMMPELIDDGPIGYQTAASTLQSYGAKRYLKAFDRLKVDNHHPLSEDLAFCERWRQCGGDIWANVEHLVGHIGMFNYAIRYADTLELQEHETKAASMNQNPAELSQLVEILRQENIKSYLEIGVRSGETFETVVSSMPPGSRAYAVDLPGADKNDENSWPVFLAAVDRLRAQGYVIDYSLGSSRDPEIIARVKAQEPFDAILIDGDHSYEGVSADFANYHDRGRLIVLHDVANVDGFTPVGPIDVSRLWGELKTQYRHTELVHSQMGIGVLWTAEKTEKAAA